MKDFGVSGMNQPQPKTYHPLIDKLRDDCLNQGNYIWKKVKFNKYINKTFN